MTCLFYIDNIMVAGGQVIQGARASATMMLLNADGLATQGARVLATMMLT